MVTKPNNSEKKNNPSIPCENSENSEELLLNNNLIDDKVSKEVPNIGKEVPNHNRLEYPNTNYTNYTNIINYTNYTNIGSLLGYPKDKAESVYFLLFSEPNCEIERVLEISGYSLNAFYNFKSREQNIISSKKGGNNKVTYALSEEFKEQLQLRINQAIEQKQRIEQNKAEAEKREAEANATQEELLLQFKQLTQNKTIVQFQGNNPVINLKELKEQEPFIFERLLEKYQETNQLLEIAFEDTGFNTNYIKYENLETLTPLKIENFRSKHLGKSVCSEVRVTSITAPRPLVTNAKFECPSCGTIISVLQIDKRFREPSRCSCGRRGGFKELSKDMVDACCLKVEDLDPQSQIPVSKDINCFAKHQLLTKSEIEKLTPGNNIRIFATLFEVPIQGIGGAILARFDWALEIISIEEFDAELNSMDFSEEDIKEFKEVSSKINNEGLNFFVKSYAPNVEGYKYEKKALIIQGSQRKNKSGDNAKTKSHIAIFGDTGVSKSVLSKFVIKVTQGSSYSSGSGASGVGLTASVIKEDGIGWIMKPGQLPLTRELAVLDEYNLITDEDKPKLQEAMSEAKISINKAGISASPSVSCGIVALANPIRGIFDNNQTITKQLNLLPQQMNRFDAIFIKIDYINKETDEKVADIMLNRYSNNIKTEYEIPFLRKFFTYIRNLKEPTLSEESKIILKSVYSKVRQETKSNLSVLINPRFLESLTRLSAGHSKLRGSDKILKKDIDEAYNILSKTYLKLSEFKQDE